VSGSGGFAGNATFSGTYEPGTSADRIAFRGNATFADSATLVVEVGGLIAGREFDQLEIDGVAQLGGTLRVVTLDLGNDYQYALLDRFQVLQFASATGAFGDFEGLDLGGGLRLEAVLESDHLDLVVIPASWQNFDNPYDVDDDGWVKPLDVLTLINDINRFGARRLPEISSRTVMPAPYLDVNGDGLVSPQDVLIVINDINAHSNQAGGEAEAAVLPQQAVSPAGRAILSAGWDPLPVGTQAVHQTGFGPVPVADAAVQHGVSAPTAPAYRRFAGPGPEEARDARSRQPSGTKRLPLFEDLPDPWDLEDALSDFAADIAEVWQADRSGRDLVFRLSRSP
jgi:hypothetical protein